jgi:hypothetical protein
LISVATQAGALVSHATALLDAPCDTETYGFVTIDDFGSPKNEKVNDLAEEIR